MKKLYIKPLIKTRAIAKTNIMAGSVTSGGEGTEGTHGQAKFSADDSPVIFSDDSPVNFFDDDFTFTE